MALQLTIISPAEDPTILVLPADTLPPDLLATERYIAPQPEDVKPGVVITPPGGVAPAVPTPGSPFAWPGSPPVQGDNLLNGPYQSAVNTPLAVVLQGAGSSRIHVYSILCRCTPGGASTLTILDGTTVLYPAGLIPPIGLALTQLVWPIGLTIRENNNLTINFTAAGAGNIVTMFVQADRF